MGLGGAPSEWDDYEWVRLADLPVPAARTAPAGGSGTTATGKAAPRKAATRKAATRKAAGSAPTDARQATAGDEAAGATAAGSLDDALTGWLREHPLWREAGGTRLLLADLDNLRADPTRWRARMAAVVQLARGADHVAMAGQTAAVDRARPHLAEFAGVARGVADGSDLADFVLLAAADAVHLAAEGPVQAVVVSNDNIFAGMADWGPLTVLSPGADALSDRLRDAATRVVDLVELEQGAGSRTGG